MKKTLISSFIILIIKQQLKRNKIPPQIPIENIGNLLRQYIDTGFEQGLIVMIFLKFAD